MAAALFLAAGLAPAVLFGQAPGTKDTTFINDVPGETIYAVADQIIDEQEVIFVGGDQGLEERLLLNGVIDLNFKLANFGDANRITYTAVPQTLPSFADRDKILVGGLFGMTPTSSGAAGTAPAQNIQRLNSNGDLDPAFNPGNGADDFVTSILPEPNGSIYVGGAFDHFNKIEHHHLVRLNVDGSLDNTFSSSLSINDKVLNVADQIDPATGLPNGQVLIVGTFNRVDQSNTAKIARINRDGSLDKSFNPVIGTRVLTVVGQPDGKILIGGSFTSVSGTAVENIARLNQDGTVDTSFAASVGTSPPGSPDPTAVYVLKLQSDGRIYVGGNFYSVDGTRREFFARLLSNGALDTSFDPGTAVINSVQSIAIRKDNSVLVGETVSRKVNNVFPPSLVRLYSDNPPPPPVVTISASKPDAVEAGPNHKPVNGQFELVRSGTDVSKPLVVYVKVGGTATSGAAYYPLKVKSFTGGTVRKTIKAESDNVTIGVRPTGNPLQASPETVTVTLQPDPSGGTNYTLGFQTTATVSISQH